MRNICRAQSAWTLALTIGLFAMVFAPAKAAAAQDTQPTLAVYTFETRGWATFAIVLPKGEATDALKVGTLDTQTDVKSRWVEDGSIKSAIVTAFIPDKGHYGITAAPASEAPEFKPTQWPTAVVEFATANGAYKAQLATAPSLQNSWLSGPLVAEARWIDTPMSADGPNTGGHPSLRVLFDVRSYGPAGSGQHWLDVTVENAIDAVDANAVTYDVKLTIGGAIPVERKAVVHKYLTRWRMTFPVSPAQGPLELAHVIPDFGPFIRAGAIPNYMRSVVNPAYSTAGPAFDILKFGSLHLPMNDHGGRPEIAPYPNWAAQAIVHRMPTQLEYVIKHGELAGSFATHIREPQVDTQTGHDWVTIDKHPNYWLHFNADPNVGGQSKSGPLNELTGLGEQGDIAHQPSLAYIPYLITGQRYFLDELTHWAAYTLLATRQDLSTNLRGGGFQADGRTPLFPGSHGLIVFNEVRGIGWGLRNIADAAFILPDEHPLKEYFAEKVTNNLAWLDDYATTFNLSGEVRAMFPFRRGIEDSNNPPYVWIALWEQSYVGWAVDRARRILADPNGIDFLTRLAEFDVKLFQSPDDVFPREWAGIYVLAVGEYTGAFQASYFPTLKQVFTVSSNAKRDPASTIGDFYREFEGFYGPESRLMLMIARGLNIPGADEAYTFLMNHKADVWPNGAKGSGIRMIDDLNLRSGWAIGIGGVNPRPTDVTPDSPTPRTNAVTPISQIQ
jgi:hypothetical protein